MTNANTVTIKGASYQLVTSFTRQNGIITTNGLVSSSGNTANTRVDFEHDSDALLVPSLETVNDHIAFVNPNDQHTVQIPVHRSDDGDDDNYYLLTGDGNAYRLSETAGASPKVVVAQTAIDSLFEANLWKHPHYVGIYNAPGATIVVEDGGVINIS